MRRGFTLVELLVVIVIIGVMVMMIAPSFSAGSDAARVRTASRGVMQMSKYARTMALLHQTPVELSFTSEGALSVAPVGGGGGESLVSEKAFAVTNSAEAAAAKEAADAEAQAAAEGGSGGSSFVMADVAVDKKYEQISFVFEGYTDTLDSDRKSRSSRAEARAGEDEPGEGGQSFRVRYKSNGTCRPYRVRVAAAGTESVAMTVVVDMLGSAKVEEEDE
jgi:prepilin-type N-terminal cleavage/methylation domain-containing protein